MKLGCVQPGYLPWIPFFKRIQQSDIFVYLDDVEFSKNNFHNRNKIRTTNGEALLTVPVFHKGHSHDFISEIKINNEQNWKNKHWKTIEYSYNKAPFFKDLHHPLKQIYNKDWHNLSDLNISLIEIFKSYFNLKIETYKSSDFKINYDGNDKLVELCKILKCNKFIVKPNTEHYHPISFFKKHKISFEFFEYNIFEYDQIHSDFIEGLSILDLAMNCGPEALK
tara:strand:- start:762 stop:1430 length:669 start_codon:yes stop_codon:yes gene_type:complete